MIFFFNFRSFWIIFYCLQFRRYFIGKKCKCQRKFTSNDFIIITGATSGIGLELAKELAKRGKFHVVM